MSDYETFKKIINKILPAVERRSLKLLHSPEYRNIILKGLPEKSTYLTINLVKDIWAIEDSKLLIIKMHLYMEAIVNEILTENLERPAKIENYSFYRKVQILYAMGILDQADFNDLKYLNKIRNIFAHNLTYDIAEIDMSRFSNFKGVYSIIDYERKAEKRMLNLWLLGIEMFFLLMKFEEKFPFIRLIAYE